MSRSPVALLLLLVPFMGCDGGSDATGEEAGAGSQTAEWFPAAPFRDDIRLPEASQARPWRPPAEGPVPVVEILRDGSWLLDGEPVDGYGDARRAALEARLLEIAKRMPQELLIPDLPRVRIPSNPAFIRVDRDAPWEVLRKAIETCHSSRVQIFRIELQVGTEGSSPMRCMPTPMSRDVGFVDVRALVQELRLVLEAKSPLEVAGRGAVESPVELSFGQSFDVGETPAEPFIEERFSSADSLLARLQEIGSSDLLKLHLRAPANAPVWAVVAALDLGTKANLDIWFFPPMEEHPSPGR